jgi:hypothetical protein
MPRAKESNVECNSLNHLVTVMNIRMFLPKSRSVIHSRSIFLHENLVYSKVVKLKEASRKILMTKVEEK